MAVRSQDETVIDITLPVGTIAQSIVVTATGTETPESQVGASISLIEPKDLPQRLCGLAVEKRVSPRLPDTGLDLRNAVESFENQLIRQALERTKWNKKQAASLLGLNRTTLVEMLKRKRINPRAA